MLPTRTHMPRCDEQASAMIIAQKDMIYSANLVFL